MPCPFESKLGFSTIESRQEYLDAIQSSGFEEKKEQRPAIDLEAIERLQADLDTTTPLYFWQLYSLIGKDPIMDIVTTFYHQVFADDEPMEEGVIFRDAFVDVAPMDMHIKAQSAYWLDSFGGGRLYWGGHSRLGFHHSSQHSEPVMTAAGAKRWMTHMKHAISSYDFVGNGYTDPRVLPCIVDFLRVKVLAYAHEFGWEFDETEFDVADFQYPPKDVEGYKVAERIDTEVKPIKVLSSN